MVKNSHGTLSGSTKRLRGKMGLTVSGQVKTFEVGTQVVLDQRSLSRGQPHMRYKGRHGMIIARRGKCYVIEVQDGGMKKQLIADPIHLRSA